MSPLHAWDGAQIYKHMVKRIRDEGLQDQADLAVLREEVETAAKVQVLCSFASVS